MMARDKEARKEYDRKRYALFKASRQKQRLENPDSYKDTELKSKYGIGLDDYYMLLGLQGGGCAICGSVDPKFNRRFFCIDHDHGTGKVRGLLCHTCNLGIGHLHDSLQLVNAAGAYLSSPPFAPFS